jgi:hypothetical protein
VAQTHLRRRLIWLLVVAFVIAGGYFACTARFERWAGPELQRAAPVARRVIPLPAKQIIREAREALPVYGPPSQWLARKSASIVYFGIVSAFVLVLRRRRPTTLRETLLVTVLAGTTMSLIVEILEWPFGEPFVSELFDLGCGAVGGVATGLLAWIWLRPRSTA